MLDQVSKPETPPLTQLILEELRTSPDPGREYVCNDFIPVALPLTANAARVVQKIVTAVRRLEAKGLVVVTKREVPSPRGSVLKLFFRLPKEGELGEPPLAVVDEKQEAEAQAAFDRGDLDVDAKTGRKIYALLDDVFDETKHRYRDGWNDLVTAKKLGLAKVIVAHIRAEAYGELEPEYPTTIIAKSDREHFRIYRREWKGKALIDVRTWFKDSVEGGFSPGKGVSFPGENLREVIAALTNLLAPKGAA